MPVREQGRRQAMYLRYVEDEVAPFIRHIVGDGAPARYHRCQLRVFHAANAFFRRPDLFGGVIGMSGFYDLSPSYFKGYSDDNCYFNNPKWYVGKHRRWCPRYAAQSQSHRPGRRTGMRMRHPMRPHVHDLLDQKGFPTSSIYGVTT